MGFLFVLLFGIFALTLMMVLVLQFLFTVEQQTAAIIQRFGEYHRVARPGLNIKIPFIDEIAARLSLRIQQLDVRVETKTEDDVFVHVVVSVQYYIPSEKVYDAYYKLSNPHAQITAFVFDVVRARVPKMKIDDLFSKKDEIADAVKEELSHTMNEFGYNILKSLVTDIEPDAKVKLAMNEINAAQRMRIAANEKGEADRILKVKAAEAEAQSKALQGKGIADQRRAIVEGLRESVDDFVASVPGCSAHDVMNLVLMTQYFDTLKAVSYTHLTLPTIYSV